MSVVSETISDRAGVDQFEVFNYKITALQTNNGQPVCLSHSGDTSTVTFAGILRAWFAPSF